MRSLAETVLLISCVLLGICAQINADEGPKLETVKQWSLLSYNFPWNWPVSNKEFNNPENIVATGIEIGYDRIFVATPRIFSGIPATLSSIPRGVQGDSPVLNAYPDWSHHAAGTKEYNCSDLGLVSVYRIRLDSCNRLWVLDSGVSRSLEDYEVTCPPKILIYDLSTDQVVRRIDFPKEVVRGESLFTNLIIDETTSHPDNRCDDVFVYISDTVAAGIVVYDSGSDLTWRVSHPAMYPDPDFAESTIAGQRFTLMDGVVGLAFDEDAGIIYFQPVATDRLFSVPTKTLRAGPIPFGKELPVKLVGRKSSQGLGLGASPKGGTIFFSPFSATAVASWNPRTNQHTVIAQDEERLQFVAELRTPVRDQGALYILTSRFHRFFLKNLDVNDFNTRIMRIDGLGIQHSMPHQPYGVSHNNIYPAATTQSPFKPSPFLPSMPPHPSGPQTYSFVQNYFTNPKQPYQYESAALIDSNKNSPFANLNSGEKQHVPHHERLQYGLTGEVYYPKINNNFNDFNGLRAPTKITSQLLSAKTANGFRESDNRIQLKIGRDAEALKLIDKV